MPSEKSLENLTYKFVSGELAPKEAQKKSAKARKRNNDLLKLGKKLMQAQINVPADMLASIEELGIDVDDSKPELQMILLAQTVQMAMDKKLKPFERIAARNQLLEMTRTDVHTYNASEERKIKRERLKIEKERLELERQKLAMVGIEGADYDPNAQINALADLINNPVPNVDIETLEAQREGAEE